MTKVFTAFSGYDSQCLALNRLGIDYELVGWSEIDKNAIKAHDALFPQWAERNYGDISKVDWAQVPDFDLFTYSSPCQDFSQAGLQRGGVKGSGTRSSLLWECERAIIAKKPKYLLMENVAALVSQKFIKTFQQWMSLLDSYGYRNYAQVLNAKDYGVPQNRERIFLVSVREDCLPDQYYFPKAQKLTRLMKDVLEQNVDEKYYLSDAILEYFNRVDADKTHGHNFTPKIITRPHGYYKGEVKKKVAPAVKASAYAENNHLQEPLNAMPDGTETTLTTAHHYSGNIVNPKRGQTEMGVRENFRIRKLTPRECFRLMDVDDKDIDTIQAAGISDSQQYKLAGNSIVVNVLTEIFRKLLVDTQNDDRQLRMF